MEPATAIQGAPPHEAWRLPPTLLPDGERRDIWIEAGRFSASPVAAAEPLPGRFALPGLVDAHAHLAMNRDFGPGTAEGALLSLRTNLDQGVLLVRDVGAPKSVTLDLRPDASMPRLIAAGRWLARKDRFFERLHDPVEPDELIEAALAEVARGARWVKVLADWRTPELSYDPALLRRLVDAVHRAGARVAAHTSWEGSSEVVNAGVDSIEHGCLLDADTLARMAGRGAAWTPTLTAVSQPLPDDAPAAAHEHRERKLENYRRMLPVAVALGLTILAGTDAAGRVVDEVANLVAFGLTPVRALRAATVDARVFLRVPAIDEGAPGDVVTFEEDPREDPAALARPAAIVLNGRRVS